MNDTLTFTSILLLAIALIIAVDAWKKNRESMFKSLVGKQHKTITHLRNENRELRDQVELLKKDNETVRRILDLRSGGNKELSLASVTKMLRSERVTI